MTEHDIQRAAIAKLRDLDYTVWTNSDRRKAHATRGMPDVFVAIGQGLAVCMEFKSPTGKLSPEQSDQVRRDGVHVCRSVLDAIAAVKMGERKLRED